VIVKGMVNRLKGLHLSSKAKQKDSARKHSSNVLDEIGYEASSLMSQVNHRVQKSKK